jgi:hypothetical protein
MLKTTSVRLFVLACSAAFTLLCASSNTFASALDVTNPAVVEAFVDGVVKPAMKENHSPSGVVIVMKDGGTGQA